MSKWKYALLGLTVASLIPALAAAQSAPTPLQSQDALRLERDKADERAAEASHNQAQVAKDKAAVERDDQREWGLHHPPTPAQIAEQDRRLATARADAERANKSGNPALKAKADAELKAAYQADWGVHHWKD